MKNNVGEAIVISTVLIILAYAKFEYLGVALGFFLVFSTFTWSHIIGKSRDKTNNLEWKKTELENEKLRLEIENLKRE